MFATQMRSHHAGEPSLPDAPTVEVVDEPHAINLVRAINSLRCLQDGARLFLSACDASIHLKPLR